MGEKVKMILHWTTKKLIISTFYTLVNSFTHNTTSVHNKNTQEHHHHHHHAQ